MSSMQVIMRMGRRSGGSLETVGGTCNHHPCPPPSSCAAPAGPESLESGLEDSFPASDAINVVQPAPTVEDQKTAAGGGQDRGRRWDAAASGGSIHHGGRFPFIFCGICQPKGPIMVWQCPRVGV